MRRDGNIRTSFQQPVVNWQWENALAGSAAGLATASFTHPLDVIRTRFQVNDGRISNLPTYKNTLHAFFNITRTEGFRGLYAGFYPAVLGSTISWGFYFFFYSKAKERYLKSREELSAGLHLASAAEAEALVCLCTNPIWLVKTRLQLQTPQHHARPYSGFHDAIRIILKDEGWRALYRGLAPGLFLLMKNFVIYMVNYRSGENEMDLSSDNLLNSIDYATLGASSKVAAVLMTYPSQVIRVRLQQRPNIDGIPRYMNSWHVIKETARFEGITANLLKNAPAASLTFIVYENVLNILKLSRMKHIIFILSIVLNISMFTVS